MRLGASAMRPPPSLDSLRCFVEAARQLNFRAAARVVALTPAALGQRIQQLEAQMGRPLFHRTTRRVTLTEAGLALLPYAKQALIAADACLRAGSGEAGPPPQELVLGTRHELGMSWIVPMLPMLRLRHPALTFHLYFGSGSDLLLRVRSGEVHCAVGSMRLDDPKLESVRLHREDYVLVGQPALLRRTPLRRAQDAARHTLVDERAALPLYAYWRDAAGGRLRLPFGRIVYFGTIAAMRAVVLAGDGVAVLPHYLVAQDLAARRLMRVLPRVRPLHDYFRLIFRADDPRRSLYQAMAESMAQVAVQ
jgi:LysR family transcriptional regulator, glycine cleavage system transcriptional activator